MGIKSKSFLASFAEYLASLSKDKSKLVPFVHKIVHNPQVSKILGDKQDKRWFLEDCPKTKSKDEFCPICDFYFGAYREGKDK